ncbi:MAG: NAD-dependent epimerase/dehydratase family protein [Candidatus Pacebacteria bacterium]|nr:NAD-dependent epimerase/dehydratase family protein [Candidatus Paceibacterota bacterium]
MDNEIFKKLIVNKDSSLEETMKVIDREGSGIAFIIDEGTGKFFGLVTDGDIRRAILEGKDINLKIKEIANQRPIIINEKLKDKEISELKNDFKIKRIMPAGSTLKIPVLDKEGFLRDIACLYIDSQKRIIERRKKQVYRKDGIKKVLVVGGAGYLGSVLSLKLLDKGYEVRVLDNLTYGDEGIKGILSNENFEFLKGDIRNVSNVLEAIKGTDAVIHLAAIVGDPACQIDAERTQEINYLSTKMIAEICKFNQVNKFLFASTCSVYGANENPDKLLDENSPLNPISLYAKTKIRSEEGIIELIDNNFLPTIFRFATLYGISPRMRFDLFVNLLTAQAASEKRITIFGGSQWRPNLDVSDAASACINWLESSIDITGGRIFNVGGNLFNHQISEIGDIIKKIIPDINVEIKEEKQDLRNYNVSFDKINKSLGFSPNKTIEEAVIEIKNFIEEKNIKDFKNPKYNNYRFLMKENYEITYNKHLFKA